MGKTILTTSRGNFGATGTTAAGVTTYWWLGNATLNSNTSEPSREVRYRTPGTFSKLYVRIVVNSTTADSTLHVRKNGTNSAITVTIPAGTTGVFEDTTNSATAAAGDRFDYRTVSGGTGTFTMALVSIQFDTSSGSPISKQIMQGYDVTTASVTHYVPISGNRSGTTTTEANTESTVKIAGTVKNALVLCNLNSRTTNTTVTLRKNRVDTAFTFTYTAGETGTKENISDTVSVSVDDELDWSITTSTGTEIFRVQHVTIEFETSAGNGFITAGTVGGSSDITVGPSVTEYYVVGGSMIEAITTEADAQMKVRQAFTFSNLTVYARANTITAPSTFTLRKNGVDTALTVTIGASATGFIVDTTHSVDFAPDDLISYKLVTGGTGTLLTIAQMAVWNLPLTLIEVTGSGGGSQGRPPLYRQVRRREPEIAIAIIRVRIPLEYAVERLSVQIVLPYTFVPEKKLIKYASAILTPLARILPLPIKPAPPPPVQKIVRVSVPLIYEVTNLSLKAACSYQVDRLFTREEQHKIVATSINFLLSDF